MNGIQEVSGSIPLISTTKNPASVRTQDFFFLNQSIKNIAEFRKIQFYYTLCCTLCFSTLQGTRYLPQVIQIHVLIIARHGDVGVPDQLQHILFRRMMGV